MSKIIIKNKSSVSDLKALDLARAEMAEEKGLINGMSHFQKTTDFEKLGVTVKIKMKKKSVRIVVSNGKSLS